MKEKFENFEPLKSYSKSFKALFFFFPLCYFIQGFNWQEEVCYFQIINLEIWTAGTKTRGDTTLEKNCRVEGAR